MIDTKNISHAAKPALIYGTTNPAKLQSMRGFLAPLDCLSVHIETGEYYYWKKKYGETSIQADGFRKFFREALGKYGSP